MSVKEKNAEGLSTSGIPEFKTLEDFSAFVKSLKAETIQKWTTKDWVDLYRNIDNARAFDKVPGGSDFLYLFVEEMNKLYQNYRMDSEIAKITGNLARQCGQYMAQKDKIHLANLFCMSEGEKQKQLQGISDGFRDAGLMNGEIPMSIEKLEKTKNQKTNGIYYNGNISIDTEVLSRRDAGSRKDAFKTIFHELAHGGLQLGENRNTTLFPEEFYTLCNYNDRFYYGSCLKRKLQEEKKSYDFAAYKRTFGFAAYKRTYSFDSYEKQPLEAHANLFGYLCERAYREEMNPRERVAINAADYIGEPEKISYMDNLVEMEYSPKAKQKMKILSALLPNRINFNTKENGNLSLEIKPDYTSNRVLYALAHNKVAPALVKSALNWVWRTQKKVALSLMLFGSVVADIGVNTNKILEDQTNNAINKEWMAMNAGATYVYADAKNGTFGAEIKMTEAEKQKYLQQIDSMEQKYMKLAQDDKVLKSVIGDNKIVSSDKGYKNIKWHKLSDGEYIVDTRETKVKAYLDEMRRNLTQNPNKEVIFIRENYNDKYHYQLEEKILEEAVSSDSFKKYSKDDLRTTFLHDIEDNISMEVDISADYSQREVNKYGMNGKQVKEILLKRIADKKQNS